ncbi:hypothetical protein [Streptomyces sp. BH105]|uniref:hypothetical protein n=1 Tax=Streptomyces sp. BH105 TaxID=3410408 RepID=UPI003CF5C32B
MDERAADPHAYARKIADQAIGDYLVEREAHWRNAPERSGRDAGEWDKTWEDAHHQLERWRNTTPSTRPRLEQGVVESVALHLHEAVEEAPPAEHLQAACRYNDTLLGIRLLGYSLDRDDFPDLFIVHVQDHE